MLVSSRVVSSTPIPLIRPARTPHLRVIAACVLALVTLVGGTFWYVENREFIAMQAVMEHNEVAFERVDPADVGDAVHVPPGDAVQTAIETHGVGRFPHSQPYLGRFTAGHLGRGFEDELVYAVRVKGHWPGPIVLGDGEPQEFVVIVPARDSRGDGLWSIALPAKPPYLTRETMR